MSVESPVESNPVEPTAAPTGQAEVSTGTPDSQNGQAATQAQSAPAEESFSSIDPNTLPPELQAAYKSMQADYTKKTQSIAEFRKKAEGWDQISKDQRFVDYWQGLNKTQKAEFKEQKVEAEKRLGEKITDERFAKAFESKDDFLSLMEEVIQDRSAKSQKEIQELKQQLSLKDAADTVESFATEIVDGKPVRPDFYALNEDSLITGYLQINPPDAPNQQSYTAKLNEAYSWAKQVSQKYYEKGRADALARIQQKAATSTQPPTNAAKGVYSGKNPKDLTVREAIDAAKRGERVPQDY